jgi:hypothetical protein
MCVTQESFVLVARWVRIPIGDSKKSWGRGFDPRVGLFSARLAQSVEHKTLKKRFCFGGVAKSSKLCCHVTSFGKGPRSIRGRGPMFFEPL